jgi:hypothetical protein
MLSAPAHIAAMIVMALPAGFAPVVTPRLTCSASSAGRPLRPARLASGTRPAEATRSRSENDAEIDKAA